MSRPPITDVVFDMETQDPDDFLCLLFLASHPRVNLKAVTITPGSREQVGLVRWALCALGLDGLPVGAGDLQHPAPAVSPWHHRAFFAAAKSLPVSSDAQEAWRVLVQACDANTVLSSPISPRPPMQILQRSYSLLQYFGSPPLQMC